MRASKDRAQEFALPYAARRPCVHFDPVGSEQASATDIREFEEDVPVQIVQQARVVVRESEDVTALEERRARADFDEERGRRERRREGRRDRRGGAAAAVREGLPSRFRMRHTPHYVDELLGEAPLRTVREIPLSEIELPTEDRAQLEELERSIRRLGVIEPLLVGRRGACYRVIAGMRRLRAAHRIGLNTVPCLVHDADEERLADMRRAVIERTMEPLLDPAASACDGAARHRTDDRRSGTRARVRLGAASGNERGGKRPAAVGSVDRPGSRRDLTDESRRHGARDAAK